MNEKPGQVYQKCLITYSVAVFFSRSRISSNLSFKLSFIVVFFRMVHKRNFSEGPELSIGPIQKVQREVISFPYVRRKNAAINCPKIVAYTVKLVAYTLKLVKFPVRVISEQLIKK